VDLRRLAKSLLSKCRQFVGRLTIADRYLRGAGLEIGALQDPLRVPHGVEVQYVDIATTEELRKLYPNKRARHLVDVDIVDDGERLGTVADATQDFVIANHFLEHCEDPIGTLRNLLRVVRPGGVVYLSVPDKRFTFDQARPVTTLDHVLRDHEQGPEQSRDQHYEEAVQNAIGQQGPVAVAERVRELKAQQYRIHFHCWTQLEFMELLTALQRRPGFPAFAVDHFARNEAELLMVLRREAAV
jgi:predicted SAM-dependent methyltransferase